VFIGSNSVGWWVVYLGEACQIACSPDHDNLGDNRRARLNPVSPVFDTRNIGRIGCTGKAICYAIASLNEGIIFRRGRAVERHGSGTDR
jgi:hypothetical protein